MSDFGTTSIRRMGNLGNGLKFNDGIPNTGFSPYTNKQYVRVPPSINTYIAGSGATFSVYCIFNTKAFSSTNNILFQQENGVGLEFSNSWVRLRDVFPWYLDCNTTAVTLNKTQHLCGIKKSQTNSSLFMNDIEMYLDNDKLTNSVSSGDLTQFNTYSSFTGGTGTIISTRNNIFDGLPLNHQGFIFQITFFTKALSREEVDYMYRMEGAIPETAKNSLALNLLFNENKGNTVRDYSSYRNHGTLFNYTGNTATLGSNNHFVDAYTLKPITQ